MKRRRKTELQIFLTISLAAAVSALNCPSDEVYICTSGERCYSLNEKCNGVPVCSDASDESNCTTDALVTKHLVIQNYNHGEENLAWLVTPVIFCMGVVYAIYKCLKEGFCIYRRRRHLQRAMGNGDSPDSSFLALDHVSFYAMTPIPCTHLTDPDNTGGNASSRHLMVVHNQTYSLALHPGGRGSGRGSGRGLARHPGDLPEAGPPPTYDEAVGSGVRNDGFAAVPQDDPDLPAYSEATAVPSSPPPPFSANQNTAFVLPDTPSGGDVSMRSRHSSSDSHPRFSPPPSSDVVFEDEVSSSSCSSRSRHNSRRNSGPLSLQALSSKTLNTGPAEDLSSPGSRGSGRNGDVIIPPISPPPISQRAPQGSLEGLPETAVSRPRSRHNSRNEAMFRMGQHGGSLRRHHPSGGVIPPPISPPPDSVNTSTRCRHKSEPVPRRRGSIGSSLASRSRHNSRQESGLMSPPPRIGQLLEDIDLPPGVIPSDTFRSRLHTDSGGERPSRSIAFNTSAPPPLLPPPQSAKRSNRSRHNSRDESRCTTPHSLSPPPGTSQLPPASPRVLAQDGGIMNIPPAVFNFVRSRHSSRSDSASHTPSPITPPSSSSELVAGRSRHGSQTDNSY